MRALSFWRFVRSLLVASYLPLAAAGAQERTTSPHGDRLTEPCASCHRPDAWKPAHLSKTYKHAPRSFPLDGAHARTNCTGCHKALDFSKTPVPCASCHSDVHRGDLGTSCDRCHSTRSFVDPARIVRMHEATRLPLRGAHAAARCESCHAPSASGRGSYAVRSVTCFGCHSSDYRRAVSPDHYAANFPTDCASCHGVAGWSSSAFDHAATRFPLTGMHRVASCALCHGDRVFRGKTMVCAGCHQERYNATTMPPHSTSRLGTDCAGCHETATWLTASYDHSTTTFPLTGAHKAALCQDCHADKVYHGKSTACASCHQQAFTASISPPHVASGFPTTCASCHTTATWKGGAFDHSTTLYPLMGAHRAAPCVSCHADNVFKGKSTACLSCHQADFSSSKFPPHATLGFSTACSTCHGVVAWSGGVFDHATTQFPLTGGHAVATCTSCHADGVWRGKPTTCVSCHQKEFSATTNPPHVAAGFPTTCGSCHTAAAWQGGSFDHAGTAFPLTGAHLATACSGCHSDGVYKGRSTACVSCHQKDYTATTSPAHGTAGFSTTCATCHNTSQWKGAVFNHGSTNFPLTGSHAAVACTSCHGDGVFAGKSTACVSCHQAKYAATTAPAHAAAGFPTTCATCHTTTVWTGAVFNHGLTQFPLTGAHLVALCNACHSDGVYKGKPSTCVSCHQANYTASVNPPHASAGFPTTCASCHTTTAWKGATFNHSATLFPLTGAHAATACTACHGDGVYKGKSTTCSVCHQKDYAATVTPPHVASGFPTTCESCHTTTVWKGATFNHSTTSFPLTGAHVPLACTSCHGDGVYKGKTNICSGCHLAKYNATTTPSHKVTAFPTTCNTCHTTSTWLGATFNHDGPYFPIYSGKHKGRWATCADCHTSPTAYTSFTCLTCHLKPQMDSKHKGRSGYQYASPSCYSCHPKGSAG